MKFFFAVAALIGSAFAQSARIAVPSTGSTIAPGTNITVTVARANSPTSLQEVAIVLSLQHCSLSPAGTCDNYDYSQFLGTTLYLGPLNIYPENYTWNLFGGIPYHNFTVAVPPSLPSGPAVLTLSHWSLVGAGPSDLFETNNVTVNVA